ncbi:MAG TPA: PP2C family protein-serine/threonine phosphatase [Ilumatobacter sp.]|nr:PP2C family protein-serine/threonine phosphatase [Ilumatobacter sp.]
MERDPTEERLAQMVDAAARTPASDVLGLLDVMRRLLGASAVRFYVADYALRCLQQIDRAGNVGEPHRIEGTFVGRVFTADEVQVSDSAGTEPTTVSLPLMEGTSRIGVLQLDYDEWNGVAPDPFDPIVATFVMSWTLKSRYSDASARARRAEPMSVEAEVQWDLIPPLSCSTPEVALSAILQPAYEIGGDSFDYAVDAAHLEFAITDAVGHGLSAVLMSAAAINSLRNARRAQIGLVAAYEQADRSVAAQFGHSNFVTALMGNLDLQSGVLTWINAGHVLPMLVRNGTFAGTLACKPSRPLGLGGAVVEVAETSLQRGDRVLFYTDGITESRSSAGAFFGDDRLADFLVRAALERPSVHETVRRLSENVFDFSDGVLRDDATMLLMEWHGATP